MADVKFCPSEAHIQVKKGNSSELVRSIMNRNLFKVAYRGAYTEGAEKNIVSYNIARYLIYKKLRDLEAFNYGRDYVIEDIVPKLENAIRYIKSRYHLYPDWVSMYTLS